MRPLRWGSRGGFDRRLSLSRRRYRTPSIVRIERFTFSLNSSLTLGTAEWRRVSSRIDPLSPTIRPRRILTNAPCPGFVFIESITVGKTNVFSGILDAYALQPIYLPVQVIDCPPLTPGAQISIRIRTSGYVPAEYAKGNSFIFIVSFLGSAMIVH